MKEEKFPNIRKPSHRQVYSEFWNLRGQHNWEGKKKQQPTDNMPNRNSQQRSSSEARICQQQVGVEQGRQAALLRVRTGPECPEDNLRELT